MDLEQKQMKRDLELTRLTNKLFSGQVKHV